MKIPKEAALEIVVAGLVAERDELKTQRAELHAFAQEAVAALRKFVYCVDSHNFYGRWSGQFYQWELQEPNELGRAAIAKSAALLTGQPSTQEGVGYCIRASGHTGPCNGLPRIDCTVAALAKSEPLAGALSTQEAQKREV